MQVRNTSTTAANVIQDHLPMDKESQIQPGIRTLTVGPSAAVQVRNVDGAQSGGMFAALLSRQLTIDNLADMTSVDKLEVGVLAGQGGFPFAGVARVPVGKRLILCFDSRYVPAVPAVTDIIKVLPGYVKTDGTALAVAADYDISIMNVALEAGAVVAADSSNGGYAAVELDNTAGLADTKTALVLAA